MATAEEVFGRDIAFKADFIKTASGDIDTLSGLENLKEAIFRRIITTPGSIIHRPEYGVGLKRYVNKLNSLANQRQLANDIQEQLEQDPRIESVEGVSVEFDDRKPDFVKINVRVKPVGYSEQTIQIVPFGEG